MWEHDINGLSPYGPHLQSEHLYPTEKVKTVLIPPLKQKHSDSAAENFVSKQLANKTDLFTSSKAQLTSLPSH